METFPDELVDRGASGLPPRFFDRFMFNLHRADSTELCVLLGAGVYPPVDTVDGFLVLVTGEEQRNLRFSTELSATGGASAGPLAWRVVEPMAAWHLRVGPNPTGVELDVTWRARTPAWFGEVAVRDGDAISSSFAHLFQSGYYDGTLSLDGVAQPVGGWYGQRDRSRGVRTMSGGQGLHLWYQAQFPDRAVGFLYVEDRHHRRLLLEGAVLHEDGARDTIVDMLHALRFDADLDLCHGTVVVRTAAGREYEIDGDATAARGGFMAGAGYGGDHGRRAGRDHVEHDVYPLDGSVTPRTVATALTDRLTAFRWNGMAGSGILEFAHTRSPSYTYRPTYPVA